MQARHENGNAHVAGRRGTSLSAEYSESIDLESSEFSSGYAPTSEPGSGEDVIETHSERGASDQDVDTDTSSIALDSRSSADNDDVDENRTSSYISGEGHNEDHYLDETPQLDNVQKDGDNLGTVTFHSPPGGLSLPPPPKEVHRYTRFPGLLFKKEIYNRQTISDDRSAGSKIEERKLFALRGRGIETQENEKQPRTGAQVVHEAHQRSPLPLPRLVPFPIAASTAPLPAHLLQAQLQAQQRMNAATMPASKNPAGIPIPPYASGATGLIVPSTDPLKEVDNQTIRTDIKQVLDQSDPSEIDLRKLQEYVNVLQESIQSKTTPSRYQIIYRIQRREFVHDRKGNQIFKDYFPLFFDHPEWVRGQGSESHLKSNLPVTNFELYLEKNKDISFIVYRTFKVTGTDDNEDDRAARHPQPTNENIGLVNKDLIGAIETLLNSQPHYAELAREFSKSLEIPAPYLFIFHSRKRLEKFQDSLTAHAKAQFTLLFNFVTEQYAKEYATADYLLSQNKISSKFIRYLFKPGDLLISRVDDHYQGYVSKSWPTKTRTRKRVRAATPHVGTPMPLYVSQEDNMRMANDKITLHICDIDVWHWNFDGNFQRQDSKLSLEIPAIEDEENDTDTKGKNKVTVQGDKPGNDLGEKSISDLNVFPMQYASSEVVAICRRRGKTFWKCRTRSYVSYQATEGESSQNLADERYMIDLKTYRSLHPESQHGQAELKDELGPEALARATPPDEQFELLLPLKIKGYNLRIKKWFDLVADRISDVKWNKEAFQNLVIERKARNLIEALVSNQLAAEKSTDLIMGKGNGLILLLHGGPGTGKTLTAESVAEIAEKPLYRVTCGDVGTKAEDVEKYLESVLHLGKIWGCVVLLDEADVFLEQRSLEDMKRNALVSVFLRVLEYYEGILVLTSNRVGTFDEAFKSRIQLALHYPVLGEYQRLRIWEIFIKRLESFGDDDKVDIADLRDHLDELKEEKMNGRQIRNAITTARQYAKWEGKVMTYKHLSDVIEVSGRFDKYLDRLNGGMTQEQLAEDEGIRLDDSRK